MTYVLAIPTFQIYLIDSLYHSIDVNIIPNRRRKKKEKKKAT